MELGIIYDSRIFKEFKQIIARKFVYFSVNIIYYVIKIPSTVRDFARLLHDHNFITAKLPQTRKTH